VSSALFRKKKIGRHRRRHDPCLTLRNGVPPVKSRRGLEGSGSSGTIEKPQKVSRSIRSCRLERRWSENARDSRCRDDFDGLFRKFSPRCVLESSKKQKLKEAEGFVFASLESPTQDSVALVIGRRKVGNHAVVSQWRASGVEGCCRTGHTTVNLMSQKRRSKKQKEVQWALS
jgi:hypothetical protein